MGSEVSFPEILADIEIAEKEPQWNGMKHLKKTKKKSSDSDDSIENKFDNILNIIY